MPKKSRTPPPPRRPQGPRQRSDARAPAADERRNRLILYGLAASGIVGLAVVLGLFALGGGGGGNDDAVSALRDAGCTYKQFKEQPRSPHYTTLPPTNPMKYNSTPPTSGRHYYQPLVFGPYDSPIDEYQAVHNLEHGAVIIQWGDKVPASDAEKIRDFYQEDANAVIIAPYPKLGDKIALTAWTRLATCTRFDEDAFSKFRDAFRYKAPEKFPADQLNPGM